MFSTLVGLLYRARVKGGLSRVGLCLGVILLAVGMIRLFNQRPKSSFR